MSNRTPASVGGPTDSELAVLAFNDLFFGTKPGSWIEHRLARYAEQALRDIEAERKRRHSTQQCAVVTTITEAVASDQHAR